MPGSRCSPPPGRGRRFLGLGVFVYPGGGPSRASATTAGLLGLRPSLPASLGSDSLSVSSPPAGSARLPVARPALSSARRGLSPAPFLDAARRAGADPRFPPARLRFARLASSSTLGGSGSERLRRCRSARAFVKWEFSTKP